MNPIVKVVVDVLATGALGVWVWWLYKKLEKRWPQMGDWDVLEQRAVVAALCPVVVAPVYAFAVAMQWLVQPADWRSWVVAILDYALAAFLWSQGRHAIEKDREAARAKDA